MSFSHHQLLTHPNGLKTHLQAQGWVVAVSGGLDSMCLLHCVVQLAQNCQCPWVRVLHVHHGLHLQADQWQQEVEAQCQRYGITCISQKVQISPSVEREKGLEAAARDARYHVFEQQLQAGEVLLLAQHADDQTETLFLRLLRGAGVAGLRAMPWQRPLGLGALVRPLLNVSQSDLHDYACQHQLTWCEDPSNENAHFDRNYLRHKVMPSVRDRWPSLNQRVATTVAVMGETQLLLDEVASNDLASIVNEMQVGKCLPLDQLKALGQARRHNLLRYWLSQNDVQALDYAAMQRLDKDFLYSEIDAQPYLQLGDWCLRRHQGHLHLVCAFKKQDSVLSPWVCVIQKHMLSGGAIALPDGLLRCKKSHPIGIALAQGDILKRCYRAGGERFKPSGRAHSQSLKKLLQEAKVPAWERDTLPLFYVNGELAMVADLWVVSGFETAMGSPAWGWQKAT